VGWIYQASAYPVKIPQQVVQFTPPPTAQDTAPALATVDPQTAAFDPDSKQLTLEVTATNVASGPVDFVEFTTSTLTFVPAGSTAIAPAAYSHQVKVSPSGTLQPGQTTKLTLTLDGKAFEEQHLVPVGESQLTIAGLMVFKDSAGKRASVEIEEPLRPRYKE